MVLTREEIAARRRDKFEIKDLKDGGQIKVRKLSAQYAADLMLKMNSIAASKGDKEATIADINAQFLLFRQVIAQNVVDEAGAPLYEGPQDPVLINMHESFLIEQFKLVLPSSMAKATMEDGEPKN